MSPSREAPGIEAIPKTMPRKRSVLTKKQKLSEQSRARLIDAATTLFAERGFKSTSIEQIARTAGISRGSIYWHFGSKSQLLMAVTDDIFNTWAKEWTHGQGSGQAAIEAIIDTAKRWVRNPKSRLLPMLLFEALSHPKSALRSKYADRYETARQYIRSLLLPSQRNDELQAGVDLTASVAVIWAALIGLSLQWRLDPDHVDVDGAWAALNALLERGLFLRPAPAPVVGAAAALSGPQPSASPPKGEEPS